MRKVKQKAQRFNDCTVKLKSQPIHQAEMKVQHKSTQSCYNTQENQRTNGPVNAHLRSAAYTNKHV